MSAISRRQFLGTAGAAALAGLSFSRSAFAIDTPLAFQTHSLRDWFIRDFAGTLDELREVGYSAMEITSFHGFKGDRRGDYGPLTDMPPQQIRMIIADAGLKCESSHFMAREFDDAGFGAASEWAQGLAAQLHDRDGPARRQRQRMNGSDNSTG